jgi:uncharacterized protein YprB with RNaseH-like and TPR domain
MLQNSFIFLDGVGTAREISMWREGILSWSEFIGSDKVSGLSAQAKARADDLLSIATERLRGGEAKFFASLLKSRDHWRCFDEFRDGALYLDIETTGTSKSAPITIVGAYDGRRMHSLIRGQSLEGATLRALLEPARMLVTFNGASFDIPMLESHFPGSVPEVPHLDLKHLLRRLGHTGGLKEIEPEMGVERDLRIQYLTGRDAAYLWRLWQRKGSWNALETLKEYNAEDCRNLETIADIACRELKHKLMGGASQPAKV